MPPMQVELALNPKNDDTMGRFSVQQAVHASVPHHWTFECKSENIPPRPANHIKLKKPQCQAVF